MTPADRRKAVKKFIGTEPDDFGPDDLNAIANGGIMDPARIYLPAGKLTSAQAAARARSQVEVPKK